MQTFHKRLSVISGCFLLLLILLVGNTYITRSRLSMQIDNEREVAKAQHVLLELGQTESLVKDAETGQRGFLYTGDPKYLAPYNLAVEEVDSHIERLARLTAGNPHQEARIQVLRSLAHRKLRELAQTISLYRSGRADAAKTLVLSNVGLVTMNEIQAVMSQMLEEETSVRAIRADAYRKSVKVTITSIYLTSWLAALGLTTLAYYILREMDLRERQAAETSAREERFRVTLNSIGDAVIATDENGRVTFLNSLAERLTGWDFPSARGKAIREVFPIFNEYTHQAVENPVKKVIELGRVVGLANHTVLQNSDRTLIPIEDSAAPILDDRNRLVGVVLVFRDASRERKLQEILHRTENLSAEGRVAATLADEINNPLEAVGTLISLAKATPGMPSDAVERLGLAEQQLKHVSNIICSVEDDRPKGTHAAV